MISDCPFHMASQVVHAFKQLKVLKLKNLPNLRIYKGERAWMDEEKILDAFPRLQVLNVQGNPYVDITRLHKIVEKIDLFNEKLKYDRQRKTRIVNVLQDIDVEVMTRLVKLEIDSGEDE